MTENKTPLISSGSAYKKAFRTFRMVAVADPTWSGNPQFPRSCKIHYMKTWYSTREIRIPANVQGLLFETFSTHVVPSWL